MKNIIYILLSMFVFSSCVTKEKTLYSLYNYDELSYQYNKKKTEELQKQMLALYKKIESSQNGTRKVVPPGMYAEYGYLLGKMGNKKDAIKFLKKEIELYPESKVFINRIIKMFER